MLLKVIAASANSVFLHNIVLAELTFDAHNLASLIVPVFWTF